MIPKVRKAVFRPPIGYPFSPAPKAQPPTYDIIESHFGSCILRFIQ
jgi:hypothetical protein